MCRESTDKEGGSKVLLIPCSGRLWENIPKGHVWGVIIDGESIDEFLPLDQAQISYPDAVISNSGDIACPSCVTKYGND